MLNNQQVNIWIFKLLFNLSAGAYKFFARAVASRNFRAWFIMLINSENIHKINKRCGIREVTWASNKIYFKFCAICENMV